MINENSVTPKVVPHIYCIPLSFIRSVLKMLPPPLIRHRRVGHLKSTVDYQEFSKNLTLGMGEMIFVTQVIGCYNFWKRQKPTIHY